MKKILIFIFSIIIALIIGASVEKQHLINHIQVVGVGENYVDINFGHEELDDGHYSDDEVHRYVFNTH